MKKLEDYELPCKLFKEEEVVFSVKREIYMFVNEKLRVEQHSIEETKETLPLMLASVPNIAPLGEF